MSEVTLEIDGELVEQIEDLIYEKCRKDTLNLDEYEVKYGVDLREEIYKAIESIAKKLNKENAWVCIARSRVKPLLSPRV